MNENKYTMYLHGRKLDIYGQWEGGDWDAGTQAYFEIHLIFDADTNREWTQAEVDSLIELPEWINMESEMEAIEASIWTLDYPMWTEGMDRPGVW